MKSLLVNLSVSLLTLLVILAAGEAVFRIWPQERSVKRERDGTVRHRFNPFRPDDVVSYALRPDWETGQQHAGRAMTVTTNGLGLRGPAASSEPAPGTLRVLVVGDSFVFGLGIADDETLPVRLEAHLAERLAVPVEVLNAGVPGWAGDDYLLFLRSRGYALDPDLLVVAVMDNDVPDLLWKRPVPDAEGLPVRTRSVLRVVSPEGQLRYLHAGDAPLPDPPFPESAWLADHSMLYHWVRYRVLKAWYEHATGETGQELARRAGPPPTGPLEGLTADELARGLQSGSAFRLRYQRHLLAAIADDAAARGIPVSWLRVAHRQAGGDPEEGGFAADCHAAGERCLDTARLLPSRGRDRFFLEGDGHWNARGADHVARAVAEATAPLLRERTAEATAPLLRERTKEARAGMGVAAPAAPLPSDPSGVGPARR